jgi:hypothetical protein
MQSLYGQYVMRTSAVCCYQRAIADSAWPSKGMDRPVVEAAEFCFVLICDTDGDGRVLLRVVRSTRCTTAVTSCGDCFD